MEVAPLESYQKVVLPVDTHYHSPDNTQTGHVALGPAVGPSPAVQRDALSDGVLVRGLGIGLSAAMSSRVRLRETCLGAGTGLTPGGGAAAGGRRGTTLGRGAGTGTRRLGLQAAGSGMSTTAASASLRCCTDCFTRFSRLAALSSARVSV